MTKKILKDSELIKFYADTWLSLLAYDQKDLNKAEPVTEEPPIFLIEKKATLQIKKK